jgi:16S rRNA (guanine527-N7)-methyltransferase
MWKEMSIARENADVKLEAEAIIGNAEKIGVRVSRERGELLAAHARLMLERNEAANLTGITEPDEVVIKHIVDSLSLLRCLERFVPVVNEGWGRIVDVGSGPGYPGLALAIVLTEHAFVLVDSKRKKVEFLREVVYDLDLGNVEVVRGRAEELGRHELREQFDVAVARAVAPLPVLVEYTVPLVRVGGVAVAYKGPEGEAELTEAVDGIAALGGEASWKHGFCLPGTDDERLLIGINKIGTTPADYPRRPGMPAKRPL